MTMEQSVSRRTARSIADPVSARRVARGHASANELAALRTWLRLLACTNLVESELRTQLRDRFDTTLARFDVLAQLDAAARDSVPGLTMSELSRRLMVTNGNVTALIERLVSEKLVSRATSPTDRRSQIVRLTATGKRAFDAMTPEHREWVNGLFSGLTTEDQNTLFDLLGKLRNSIRESLRLGGEAEETT